MSGPERIWLQDAGDYRHAAQFEVTWCAEPQDDADTEYIRADLVGRGMTATKAQPLEEWHEDTGHVVWWCLKGGRWLGEPAWIGTPLCSDWPGYHTHFTPHPRTPSIPAQIEPEGGE